MSIETEAMEKIDAPFYGSRRLIRRGRMLLVFLANNGRLAETSKELDVNYRRLWDSSSIGRGNWKEIEDALVVLGWFHDDCPKWIRETRFFQDALRRSDGPSIEVEIYDLSEGNNHAGI